MNEDLPNSIGIKICVNADGDFNKAKINVMELVKFSMKDLGILFF